MSSLMKIVFDESSSSTSLSESTAEDSEDSSKMQFPEERQHPYGVYREGPLLKAQNLFGYRDQLSHNKYLNNFTKDAQRLADNLLKSTFKLALENDEIWRQGIFSFYQIIKFLEDNLSVQLIPMELRRSAAFERDLIYFYGRNWQTKMKGHESTIEYLEQMKRVQKDGQKTYLLFAYAYQIYMALLTYGQKLQRLRMMKQKLWRTPAPVDYIDQAYDQPHPSSSSTPMPIPNINKSQKNLSNHNYFQINICPDGCAATYFHERLPELKSKFRCIFNNFFDQLNDEARQEFVIASHMAIVYKMQILYSLNQRKFNGSFFIFIAIAIILGLLAITAYKHFSNKDDVAFLNL